MAVVWVKLVLRRCYTVWFVRKQASGETCCLHLQCTNCFLLKWRQQVLPKLPPLWEGQTSDCVIIKLWIFWFALAVLQGLVLFSLQDIFWRFRRTWHRKFRFNVGALLPDCTASNPRRERWRLMLSFPTYIARFTVSLIGPPERPGTAGHGGCASPTYPCH